MSACIKYIAQALQDDMHKGMQGDHVLQRLAHRRLVHKIETAISLPTKAKGSMYVLVIGFFVQGHVLKNKTSVYLIFISKLKK